MERIGDLTVQPRALSANPNTGRLRIIERLLRLSIFNRRKQRTALDDYDVYREHPELLFATDKEIVAYASGWRSHDRYEHVPLSLPRRW